MDYVIIRIVVDVAIALVLLWAVVSVILVAVYRRLWKEEESKLDRLRDIKEGIWEKFLDERQERMNAVDEIRKLVIEKRNVELALEMEQKNLEVTQEHLKYYIETLADTETLVLMKDEELERSEEVRKRGSEGAGLPSAQEVAKERPCMVKCALVEAFRWVLAKKLEENDKLRARIADRLDDVKAKTHELKVELGREFDELTAGVCSAPQFTEYGHAYDPKQRVEVEGDHDAFDTLRYGGRPVV